MSGAEASDARWAAVGALLAGAGVALGAFGAHALAPVLSEARLATFETAVRYQTVHGVALLAVAAWGPPGRAARPWLLAGALVFAGALYALVATDVSAFGAVAPVGGVALIVGWALLAWRLLRAGRLAPS